MVYLDNITFHTAVIHWVVNPGPEDTINGSYEVVIYRGTNLSRSLNETLVSSLYSIPITVNVTEMDRLGRTFHVPLSGLDQGTHYAYRIGIVSDVRIIENAVEGTFRTEQYRESMEGDLRTVANRRWSCMVIQWTVVMHAPLPTGCNREVGYKGFL